MSFPKLDWINEDTFALRFGDEMADHLPSVIREMKEWILDEFGEFVVDWITSYAALTVRYRLRRWSPDTQSERILRKAVEFLEAVNNNPFDGRKVEVPVCYSEEFGLDLGWVATSNDLTTDDVVKLHCERPVLVHAIGFSPGFSYMGPIDEKIQTPRLDDPRLEIVEGSVGIAGNQTGIYPRTSPGGWQILGRTPLKVFDLGKPNPLLFEIGDVVQFRSISLGEFQKIKGGICE